MQSANRHDKFLSLREQFPFFKFEKQEYTLAPSGLQVRFTFNLADQYQFHPSFFIPRKSCILPDEHIADRLPGLIFQIGMIELISYWKAACPSKVIIQPFALSAEQIQWWKHLYFHGLGEFFYVNSIPAAIDNFMVMEVAPENFSEKLNFDLDDSLLIPVGGGKDSAVTLGLLGKRKGSLPLILNPGKASLDSIMAAGFGETAYFEIHRTIDPMLLKLNGEGFLNGHTPFSALLGFYTVLASAMTGKKNIALSNESSANEPTIPGTKINHQYSKSVEFESGFRDYIHRWIHPEINYFSFLRPLHELQIAGIFARLKEYHAIFRSCNAGSKTGTWCGQCPKCLFTYIMLSPFLKDEDVQHIFGKNLLNDRSLIHYLDQLTGIASEKPFECIGTIDEIRLALEVISEKQGDGELPVLLAHFRKNQGERESLQNRFAEFMQHFSRHHHLLPEFENLLKQTING